MGIDTNLEATVAVKACEATRKTLLALVDNLLKPHRGDEDNQINIYRGVHVGSSYAVGFLEGILATCFIEEDTALVMCRETAHAAYSCGMQDALIRTGKITQAHPENPAINLANLPSGQALHDQVMALINGVVTAHLQRPKDERSQEEERYNALRAIHGAIAWHLGRIERHLLANDIPDIEQRVREQRDRHLREGDHKGSHETGGACPDCSDA